MSYGVALSGLNAATTHLEVVSNNIANVNTNGFKKSATEFVDLFAGAGGSGGTGRGTQLASITQQFSQGNLLNTGNVTDLAISGAGFFVVDDNGERLYTRNGQFQINKQGYVQNSSDQILQAYQPDATGSITNTIGALFVSTADNPPVATGTIEMVVNLDAGDTVPSLPFDPINPLSFNASTSANVFDSLGTEHVLTTFFVKTGSNAWDMNMALDGGLVAGPDPVTFDATGNLATPASGIVSFTVTPSGAATQPIDINLAGSTQFGGSFNVNRLVQDGFPSGRIIGVDIAEDGVVLARFNNGQSEVQGQILLADFPNEQGLAQLGLGNWGETAQSGQPLFGTAGSSSFGVINSGALEASNVDVTEMLVELITAQRNFQANAKTIETSDAITQTIINIR